MYTQFTAPALRPSQKYSKNTYVYVYLYTCEYTHSHSHTRELANSCTRTHAHTHTLPLFLTHAHTCIAPVMKACTKKNPASQNMGGCPSLIHFWKNPRRRIRSSARNSRKSDLEYI